MNTTPFLSKVPFGIVNAIMHHIESSFLYLPLCTQKWHIFWVQNGTTTWHNQIKNENRNEWLDQHWDTKLELEIAKLQNRTSFEPSIKNEEKKAYTKLKIEVTKRMEELLLQMSRDCKGSWDRLLSRTKLEQSSKHMDRYLCKNSEWFLRLHR